MTQPRMFRVAAPRTRHTVGNEPTFVLEQDKWNDYSFQTQYHLTYYFTTAEGSADSTTIGIVKILRKGQTGADGLLVNEDFVQLGEDFCSVGQSLDYYERMRDLGPIGSQAMAALRDVVADPSLVAKFEDEDGWGASLFRDQRDMGAQHRLLAAGLVAGHYDKPPGDQQSFSFRPARWQSPIPIDTTSGEDWMFSSNKALPERMNVIVGRNGSGKSTLLARLARVAYASPAERLVSPISNLGTFEPAGVGFPRVITVAFSPFDSFKLPGSDDRNRLQIAKDMRVGRGRFIFIGLRDFAAEVDDLSGDGELPLVGGFTEIDDRVSRTKLKTIEQLTDEFTDFLKKVRERDRVELLKKALGKLERGFFSYERDSLEKVEDGNGARKQFLLLSTGHKIALLTVVGLIANLEPRSLVLIDEPETHLHPPLLSAMMYSVRSVLEEFESTSVVATHSPVVVQETLARHVHVIRREGDMTVVTPVVTETFGESIGLITAQVFAMESEATDFHRVLDGLMFRYKSLEKIESLFKDGMMSLQARAYVLTRLATKQ